MIWATRGGVAIGLCILAYHLMEWYPGLKALKGKKKMAYAGDLLPFFLAWAYGALGILSVMGLVGWAFDTALWALNWLGDAAGYIGVGAKAGQSSRGAYLPLTSDGSWLVLILTAVFLAARKKTTYATVLNRGALCGLTLGTSAGIAGFAAVPLAQGANQAGALLFGAIA